MLSYRAYCFEARPCQCPPPRFIGWQNDDGATARATIGGAVRAGRWGSRAKVERFELESYEPVAVLRNELAPPFQEVAAESMLCACDIG